VVATGDVLVTGWLMDRHGEELVSDPNTVYEALLTISVTFAVHETIEDLRIESAAASPSPDGYHDDDDALNEVIAVLAQVPGLDALLDDDDLPAFSTDEQWEADVNGKRVVVTLQRPYDKDHDWVWSVEIDVSGETSTVYCYVHDTWVGGRDGFHYGLPVSLTGDDKPAEFSLARFALRTIYGVWDEAPERPGPHD
jgi:hypothetical protein